MLGTPLVSEVLKLEKEIFIIKAIQIDENFID